MSAQFTIKPATREGIKPLIVFYAESGCGKTYSALLMARGMVGPKGRIRVIDSEGGRASLYADIPEFSPYEVVSFDPPFSPDRYIQSGQFASNGADIIIYDSGSHEWEGCGGVLDMAAENEHKSGRAGLHNWKSPKFEHAKFISFLVASKIPVIVCLRAKFKTRQTKDEKGKTVIVKDDAPSPIQAEDFIFEATVHGEILPNHSLRLTKWSHPELKRCFPQNAPIELKHGQAVAAWCAGSKFGAAVSPQISTKPEPPGNDTAAPSNLYHDRAKAALRDAMVLALGPKPGSAAIVKWLAEKGLHDPSVPLTDLTPAQLTALANLVNKKLESK